MKRFLCLFLILLTVAFCCGCGGDESEDSEQLTYYYTAEYQDDMVNTIQRYNRWCSSHSTEDMKIKLIEFDNYETMSQRLNIEVMSGGGPDLFSNYMDLPFEKLMQGGTFRDLNELIENDTAEDKIDLSAYNQTIMDAGMYDGKRYFAPVFYRIHTLVGEREDLEQFGMPTEQGYHLTFDNMDEVFAEYLENPGDLRFMNDDVRVGGVNAETVIFQLVNAQSDFENNSVSFEEGFQDKLELLSQLREHSVFSGDGTEAESAEEKPVLFHPVVSFSNPIWMERMMNLLSGEFDDSFPEGFVYEPEVREPVMYTCFEDDESTYTASIVDAVFVNAKTKKDDKVLAFLKYVLGEHLQNLYAGTDEEYWSGGDGMDCLPVLNTAFDHCVRDAHKIIDYYGIELRTKDELSPITQALIEHIENVNSVVLYFDLYHSNYDKNVAIPILQEYWDGKIDAQKCEDNLASATKIYILE
ncbi:MAG: carbohydrate ABC transporter substrate-binding protein [Ruminococcus sp.]|nr:carbohydrate ABC transporter substrate-binding protein [Ruminococcus sp.]